MIIIHVTRILLQFPLPRAINTKLIMAMITHFQEFFKVFKFIRIQTL
jgi:hypothetical protein